IVTPGAPGLNVSRRIRDEETRAELERLAETGMAGMAPDLGLILRSACDGMPEDEIAADIAAMRDLAVTVLADLTGEAELLVDAPAPHEFAWREWGDPEPDEVIDQEGCFANEGAADQLDALLSAQVSLTGGGHMQIEPTRAL